MTQDKALSILKTGVNVFLTGEPGSGKTYTVGTYINYLRARKVEPAITASTGIAATHLSGMTIHSWCGIGINKNLTTHEIEEIAARRRIFNRINETSVLIIDEISMLEARRLTLVEAVCRAARRSQAPFGGLQVVLVGDFFQLPPVADKSEALPEFAYNSPVWRQAELTICYLTEQHRQEDKNFLQILTALRQNNCQVEHLKYLHARLGAHRRVALQVTRLFPHNVNVERLNEAELNKLAGETQIFDMRSHGPATLVETLKRSCLSPEKLSLKIGATVMFTKNHSGGRFVNGTLGVVIGFADDTGYPIIRTRQNKKILAEPTEWTIEERGKILAKINQIPLRLAWAITVHKSQGMSLDAAVIDLSGAFEFGQGYVALSRVRTLAGLYLTGYNNRALEVNPTILTRDQEFRQSSHQAAAALAQYSPPELQKIHRQFIKKIGSQYHSDKRNGRRPPRPQQMANTLLATKQLIKDSKSIAELAQRRAFTTNTIIQHLEKLLTSGHLTPAAIAHLKPGDKNFTQALPHLNAAFQKFGTAQLKPIYDYCAGAYDYQTIRLTRLFFEPN